MSTPIDPRCVGHGCAKQAIFMCGSPLNIEDVAAFMMALQQKPVVHTGTQGGMHEQSRRQ